DDLHRLAEQLRLLAGADEPLPAAIGRELDRCCRRCWQAWETVEAGLGETLQERTRNDLLDLAVLWADLRGRDGTGQGRREALALLDQAEARLGRSLVLAHKRAIVAG